MPCSGPGFESWRRHPRKSFKNLQKSSKSEKIEVRETRGPVYRPSRLVYRTSVTFTAFFCLVYCLFVLFTRRTASVSVLFSLVWHSEALSGTFAVSLWPRWGLEPWSRRSKFRSLTSRAYLRLLNRVLCFDRADPKACLQPGL